MTQTELAPLSTDDAIRVAEYVCGLLNPQERAQVHILLSRDDQALSCALDWENELLGLVDALPAAVPSPALLDRLQRTLEIGPPPPPPRPQLLRQPSQAATAPRAHDAPPIQKPALAPAPVAGKAPPRQHASPSPRDTPPSDTPPNKPVAPTAPDARKQQRVLQRKLWFWRLTAICATAAAIVGFALPGEPPPPPVQVIKVAPTRAAILQAPGTSSTPGWTATLGPEGNLVMQPLVYTEVPPERQALLWTRSARVPEPRLLGRIDPNRPVQVPATQLGTLADDQLLEITLETAEDAAKGVPNGPVLFIGQMAVFGAEGSVAPVSADSQASGSATGGPITQ